MKRAFLVLFFAAIATKAQQNATLLPWTPQQFTNTNGTPLANGKVCTYQAGTSTGLATYTDSTASVANSVPPNAILLDSTGRPTSGGIWLKVGLSYKITALTAGTDSTCNTGVTIKTQDQVVAPAGASLTGNNVLTGTNTFQGPILCKNFENRRCVDSTNSAGWAGADVCAWITSAQSELPSTGGTIFVADGTYGQCAGGFTLGSASKSVSLYLGQGGGAGGTLLTVNGQILVTCSNCTMAGIAGSSTTIFQGTSFPSNTPVIQLSSGTTVITAAQVTNLRVDCNGGTNSIGFENVDAQDFSGFTWDIASGCTKYGFWYEGTVNTTASLSIGEKLWATHTGTATIDFYIHGVNNFRGSYLTSVARNSSDVIPQGILVDNGSATLENINCENDTVCLDIGTTTSTIVYAKNLLGNGTSATLAKIENTANNRVNLFEIIANGSVNTIQDALVGEATISDSYLTHYETLPGPNALMEKADGKITYIGTGENKWQNAAATIDGRIGPSSFASAGLGIGTASNSIMDFYSNASVGASVEFNGTNSNLKVQNFIRQLETTAPSAIPSSSVCYADSTAHALKCAYNNGTFFQIPQVITATSAAFATATTAGTCVQNTTAVTNAATSMAVSISPVSTPGVGAVWSAFVSSAGNVTINECAVATSAGGSIAFNIRVTP